MTPKSERASWEAGGCQSGNCDKGIIADVATPKTAKMPGVKAKLKARGMPTIGSYKRNKNKKY